MWYDSSSISYEYSKRKGKPKPYMGPWNYYWVEDGLIERAYYHTLDELLKLPFNKTLLKRLSGAKEGTVLKVRYLHRGGDLMLVRLTSDEIEAVLEFESLKDSLVETKEEIKKSIPELIKKKNKLSGQISKMKLKLEKRGIV
jgi:hypothetical protein